VGGVPLINGAELGAGDTVMANAGKLADSDPSLTEMTMPEYVLTSLRSGVPERRPVVVLKLAQDGLFAIVQARMPESGSVAVGVKE
jgi:hypothetical protein